MPPGGLHSRDVPALDNRDRIRLSLGNKGYPDIVAVLSGTTEVPRGRQGDPLSPIDRRLSQAISRAIDQAGIRPSQRAHRVSDDKLELLLGETTAYQDWAATHVRFPRITRRVRIYPQALQSTELSRSVRRQAAEREFRLLEGVNHAGILKALDLHEHERGPALIFEHDPDATRLDWFLRDQGESLDIDTRLGLVRQVTEALQYAHEHRLYHRALSPQTLLVMAPTSPRPVVKNFDWQTAQRDSTSNSAPRPTAEEHWQPGLFGDPQSLLYMASEALAGMAFDAPKRDLFSLGAIAYHVFSGQAPATSIEALHQKCRLGHGLRISEVMDGAGRELQDLIQFSTCPAVEDRLATVRWRAWAPRPLANCCACRAFACTATREWGNRRSERSASWPNACAALCGASGAAASVAPTRARAGHHAGCSPPVQCRSDGPSGSAPALAGRGAVGAAGLPRAARPVPGRGLASPAGYRDTACRPT